MLRAEQVQLPARCLECVPYDNDTMTRHSVRRVPIMVEAHSATQMVNLLLLRLSICLSFICEMGWKGGSYKFVESAES